MDSRDDHFGFRGFALDFDDFSWSDFRLWIPSFGFWALRCALDFHDLCSGFSLAKAREARGNASQSIFGIKVATSFFYGERCRYIIVTLFVCTLNSRTGSRSSFGFRILDSGFEEMKIPDCCRTFIAPLEAGHVAGSGSCASARLESLPAHIP